MFKTRTSKYIYKVVNTIVLFSLLILRTSQASNVSAEEVAKGDILYGVGYASEADAAPVFTDVPYSYWAWEWIETLYRNGVTNGCSTNPPMYCPEDAVTRAQMAVFLERGVHGSDYQPPEVGSSTGFNDVPTDYWAAVWIKQLAADGITLGCGNNNYCPEDLVTRAQMAVFLLRAENGAAYSPPAVGGSTGFNDVSIEYWAAAWIKQLAGEGITTGCGNGNYCPEDPVTRAQMAVFLVRTFNLPSSIHPIGELTFHQADDSIAYNWFSYVPRSIDRSQPIYIWISGIHGNFVTDDYNQMTEESRGQAECRTQQAEEHQYILLVPVIPRPQTNNVYVVSIPHYIFLDETPTFLQRPDDKVNLMIDKLINNLRLDGYDVKDKVFIDGFSAGAMFTQRYALLHPERVQALAAGSPGGAMTLPESTYGTIQMMWPVGVSDFSTLAGYEFDMESYKQVPQYIYIGDQDTHNSTLWGTGEIWRTQAQIDFLNSTFGSTDPVRLQNQVAYLNNLGYSNITFRLYLGVGHQFAAIPLDDIFEFFNNHR